MPDALPTASTRQAAQGNPSKQIIGLDAIRCLAAVMVTVFHLGYWFWAGAADHPGYGGSGVSYEWLAPFTWFGWVGVQVFFVLSGFVIAYSANGADAGAFLRSRILRLVPAAWICATLTLAVFALISFGPMWKRDAARAWLNSLLFHLFGPWIDSSYWTLGVEVSFYAVVLALLFFKKFAHMPKVVGAIGLASVAFWSVRSLTSVWPGIAPELAQWLRAADGDTTRVLQLMLLHHGCFFAIGVFLWLCLFEFTSVRRVAMILAFVGGGMIQVVSVALHHNDAAHSNFSPLAPLLVWTLSLGLIIASVLANRDLAARFGWLASPMRRVGLMTYPLYLLHQMIGFTVIEAVRGLLPDGVVLCLTMLGLVALAYVVSAYLEPAVRRVLAHALSMWPGGTPANARARN